MAKNRYSPYIPYKTRATAFLFAVENGHIETVTQLLQNGADVNLAYVSSSLKDFAPLHLAVQKGYEDITELLLSRGANAYAINNDGKTPLHIAAQFGHLQIVEHLLNHGIDVNSVLIVSSFRGVTPLHIAVDKGNEEITELLLSRGADASYSTYDKGETPLHVAARNGFLRIVQQLLNYGADVNSAYTSSSEKGFTSLHVAANGGYVEIAKLLLSRGAHADCTNYDGKTPFHIAVSNGHFEIVKLLLNLGVDVNSSFIISFSERVGPLHLAVEKGNEEIVQLLLKRGAYVNCTFGSNGKTALHIAALNGHLPIVEHLLNHGANVNSICECTCRKDYMPLFLAAAKGHEDVVKLLLLYRANVNATLGQYGSTALEVASKNGHTETVEALLKSEEEINLMKAEKIGDTKVSFHDILTISLNQLALYANNENIAHILQSDDYKTKFPIFANMINNRFKKGIERRELLKKCSKLFNSHFIPSIKSFHELPQNCTEKILSYLNDKHLRVLIECL